MVCVHTANPRIGFFDNLKEGCNDPSGGCYEFIESDFVGICRGDDADFQFKVLLNDSLLEILVDVSSQGCRKMHRFA